MGKKSVSDFYSRKGSHDTLGEMDNMKLNWICWRIQDHPAKLGPTTKETDDLTLALGTRENLHGALESIITVQSTFSFNPPSKHHCAIQVDSYYYLSLQMKRTGAY